MRFEILFVTSLVVGLYLLVTFVMTAIILLLLVHASRFKHKPLLSWVVANLLGCLIIGVLFNWFTGKGMVSFFLIIIGQLPLSFMVWSVMQWGASVGLVRALNQAKAPIAIERWIELSSFNEASVELVENRIDLLRKLRLVETDNHQVTIFGKFIFIISRIKDKFFERKIL
jgi:hypothetical protein